MRFSPQQNGDDDALEVNITPLVDVVFLLLIFFMVTTTFADGRALDVQLPKASDETAGPENAVMSVTVTKDGSIFFEEQKLSADELATRLRSLPDKERRSALLLRADESVAHGKVVAVMDAARSAGVERIAVATISE